MDVTLLREATRPEHQAVEAAVPLIGPEVTTAGYVETLARFYTVICAWDAVAEACGPAAHATLIRERRRSEALRDDLAFFQADTVCHPSELLKEQMRSIVADDSSGGASARFWGAMYVVEGSTLGGQYIAHHVEQALGLEPGQGDRFFRGYGKETMPKWREFQEVLREIPDHDSEAVIDSAKRMFGVFQQWLQSPPPGQAEQRGEKKGFVGDGLAHHRVP